MSKTVTLRLDEAIYDLFRKHADGDNRSLSNFIETSALRYVQEHDYVDDFEMAEINSNSSLLKSLKAGLRDAKARKGQMVK